MLNSSSMKTTAFTYHEIIYRTNYKMISENIFQVKSSFHRWGSPRRRFLRKYPYRGSILLERVMCSIISQTVNKVLSRTEKSHNTHSYHRIINGHFHIRGRTRHLRIKDKLSRAKTGRTRSLETSSDFVRLFVRQIRRLVLLRRCLSNRHSFAF